MWHPEERKAEFLNGPGSRAEGKNATSCLFPSSSLHQDLLDISAVDAGGEFCLRKSEARVSLLRSSL